MSGYRRGTNYLQGYTNVGDFAGTFAVGLGDRAEIFASFLFDTRIDRDVRPIFVATDTEIGSFVDRYPRVNTVWTGDNVGDLFVGGEGAICWSKCQQNPAALAVRGMVKLPTGDDEAGASTGKTDFFVDFIVSKDVGADRGSRRAMPATNGAGSRTASTRRAARSAGARAPGSRRGARCGVNTELNGVHPAPMTRRRAATASLVGADGSLAPLLADTQSMTRAHIGLTWQHTRGFFIGTGLAWNLPTEGRSKRCRKTRTSRSATTGTGRCGSGITRACGVYVPPPPPPPAAAAPAAAAPPCTP